MNSIDLGGSVRIGMEDNPFLEPGQCATSDVQLVGKIVSIALAGGREIDTPAEALKIKGIV